jgi:hypothetical protein
MECDDGFTYVVKFAGDSRVAVNEYLGQTLAFTLGLPVPRGAFVELGPETVAHSKDLANRAIEPGVHQGSQLVANASDLSGFGGREGGLEEALVNSEALAGTVCLDNWILTSDRDRPENHLVQAVPGGFRYYLVDFTHSFTGPRWTLDTLDEGSFLRVLMPVLPPIAAAVKGQASFESTLRRIESFTDDEIQRAVRSIPTPWKVDEEERVQLGSFLQVRRGILRSVLASNRQSFPSWSG